MGLYQREVSSYFLQYSNPYHYFLVVAGEPDVDNSFDRLRSGSVQYTTEDLSLSPLSLLHLCLGSIQSHQFVVVSNYGLGDVD